VSPIKKLSGSTPSEMVLQTLCERSFLSLWSYPRPFRNQGTTANNHEGKEICDLMVVFGRDILLFSDKSCAFPDSGNLETDWKRWQRKAIEKSVDQLLGAERWIRQFPARLFLDSVCTTPFPIDLSSVSKMRFHRIAVAWGARDRCRQHFGGSGSLPLGITLKAADEQKLPPFVIRGQQLTDKFVHVFDDVTLPLVLRELDTAADFIRYLRAKEEFIASGQLLFSTGEEELLALYLSHLDSAGEPTFPKIPPGPPLLVEEGRWSDLKNSPAYTTRRNRNVISYRWDRLLEHFNALALNEKLSEYGSERGFSGHEERIRQLAKTSRDVRRELMICIHDLLAEASAALPTPGQVQSQWRVYVPASTPRNGYVFVVCSSEGLPDEPTYRDGRRGWLIGYSILTMKRMPELNDVVGIAVGPPNDRWGASEDVVYIERSMLTAEDFRHADEFEAAIAPLRVRSAERRSIDSLPTYPLLTPMKKIGRNERCPCGSGLKFKRCHGGRTGSY